MGSAQAKARRRTQAALSSNTSSFDNNANGSRRASTGGVGGNTTGGGGTGRAGRSMTYAVTIPPGVQPGGRFAVMLGGTRHEFTCPQGAGPGSTVHVQGPAPGANGSNGAASSQQRRSSSTQQQQQQPFHSVPPPRSQRTQNGGAGTRTYMVRVPSGVLPGQNFAASINGRRFVVQCPPGIAAGMPLHIRVPDEGGSSSQSQPSSSQSTRTPNVSHGVSNNGAAAQQQTFMVTVPQGIRPGQQFAVMANGQRVTVTCPASCSGGSQVYVRVPITQGRSQSAPGHGKTAEDEDDYEVLEAALAEINDKQGKRQNAFERKVGNDGKLHWVKAVSVEEGKIGNLKIAEAEIESEGIVIESSGKDMKFAGMGLVRQMSTNGHLMFVPAHEAAIDVGGTGLRGMTPELLHRASALPFKKKLKWFRQCRDKLKVAWEYGHVKVRVNRENILYDSLTNFQRAKKEDMHKIFRFQFQGEEGIDAGGLAREWFQVVSDQLFNPDFGLFVGSGIGGETVTINPQSGIANEHHLEYFRFAGRLLGKAFFDSQLVGCHLALPIYKHLLAMPITFHDLEVVDADLVSGLIQLMEMEDISQAYMDFTITEEVYGATRTIPLVEGGDDMDVTNDNVREYVQALVKYQMLNSIKDQLSEFLQGFYDVIPQPLLSIFDHREIELVLCGLPNIDKSDWRKNTLYAGMYETKGDKHRVIQWFWKVVDELEDADAARLLQFSTGTARVPVQGFKLLQGRDGDVRKFTITSIKLKDSVFPKAHTCFNRIELPLYTSYAQCKRYVTDAIHMELTGFGME